MLKRNTIFLLILIVPLLLCALSCSDSGSSGGSSPSIEAPVTNEDLKVVIGKGYDVTSRYAYSPQIKPAVLDFDALYQDGQVIRDRNLTSGEFNSVSGATANQYQTGLAVKASVSGKVGVMGAEFSSEVGANFEQSRYTSDQYAFATSTSRIVKDAYFVEDKSSPSLLIQYLAPGFKTDLQTKTPEEIVNKYGTHVMLGGIWGARLDYHFSVKKKTTGTSLNVGAYAKASAEVTFKGITAGGGTSTEVNTQYSSEFETSTVTTSTHVIGGFAEYGQFVEKSQDYTAWINSVDGNEVWSDYYPDSLIPIAEFIDNATQKSALQAAVTTYLTGKKINVNSTVQTGRATGSNILQGGAIKSQGDNEIDSENGKKTNYELTIDLTKRAPFIDVSFHYKVLEQKGDFSILEFTKTMTIDTGKNNFDITESPQSCFESGYVWDEHHGFVTAVYNCPFLSHLKVKIDGSGNDQNNIGIDVGVSIGYSYQ